MCRGMFRFRTVPSMVMGRLQSAEGVRNLSVSTPRWPWRPPVPDLAGWRARSPPRRSGSPQTRRPRALLACKKHEQHTLTPIPVHLCDNHELVRMAIRILLRAMVSVWLAFAQTGNLP